MDANGREWVRFYWRSLAFISGLKNMEIKVRVALDEVSPVLAKIASTAQRKAELNEYMGLRVQETTRTHLAQYGLSHPNKLGGKRTNYWGMAALDVAAPEALSISDTAAWLYLTTPGLSRAFGDVTIVPGTKTPGVKYLAIPARAEAYGLKPREVPGLVVFWGSKGPAGLKQVDQQKVTLVKGHKTKKGGVSKSYTRKGEVTGGLVWFWFAEQATQQQDRSLLPSDAEWGNSASQGAGDFVSRMIREGKKS